VRSEDRGKEGSRGGAEDAEEKGAEGNPPLRSLRLCERTNYDSAHHVRLRRGARREEDEAVEYLAEAQRTRRRRGRRGREREERLSRRRRGRRGE
jgi:hypothetical protein